MPHWNWRIDGEDGDGGDGDGGDGDDASVATINYNNGSDVCV